MFYNSPHDVPEYWKAERRSSNSSVGAEEFLSSHSAGRRYSDQWALPKLHKNGLQHFHDSDDKLELKIEIHNRFKEEDVKVCAVDGDIVLQARQEHITPGLALELNRSYRLPAYVDTSTLKWTLDEPGVLAVSAQKLGNETRK